MKPQYKLACILIAMLTLSILGHYLIVAVVGIAKEVAKQEEMIKKAGATLEVCREFKSMANERTCLLEVIAIQLTRMNEEKTRD